MKPAVRLVWKSNKPKPMTVLSGTTLYEGTFAKAEAYREHIRKGGRGA